MGLGVGKGVGVGVLHGTGTLLPSHESQGFSSTHQAT